MSDPVTNVEIEDVLSSIRKLVAEETRVTPPAAKPRAERPPRLVLTPAQRVKDDDPAPKAPASEPVLLTQPIFKPSEPVGERAIDEIPGDARLAEFGPVEGAFPDLEEFDEMPTDAAVSPPEDEDIAALGNLNRLIEQEVASALGMHTHEDPVREGDSDAVADAGTPDETWLDEGLEEANWNGPEEPGNHASVSNALNGIEALDEDGTSDDEVIPERATEFVPEDVKDDDADAPAPEPAVAEEPSPPLTLEDKVAALGRLVARDTNEFEEERDRPDADELSAASEPMAWPDPAPFEHVADDSPEVGSNVLHAQNAWPQNQATEAVAEHTPSEDDDVQLPAVTTDQSAPIEIDEEMLRDLVVDIVRQELQGALGERITRNVRKLVRREIHRMLISQDFD
jgi:hypothetical protein